MLIPLISVRQEIKDLNLDWTAVPRFLSQRALLPSGASTLGKKLFRHFLQNKLEIKEKLIFSQNFIREIFDRRIFKKNFFVFVIKV